MVEPYTGAIDIVAQDIFEGDIISGLLDFGPAGFQPVVVPVYWAEDAGYRWWYFDRQSIEIIGNIHEHPHLLAKTS